MALPLQYYYLNYNPAAPIPNGNFYSTESAYIQGPWYPLIVGSGLSVDFLTGVISASATTTGYTGTFTSQDGFTVSVSNGLITGIA